MQMECIQCQRLLNLPEDKLPVGKLFQFSCPYCKGKNTACISATGQSTETPPSQTEKPPLEEESEQSAGSESFPGQSAESESESESAEPEPFPGQSAEPALPQPVQMAVVDNQGKALVLYDDERTTKFLVAKLNSLGFDVNVALNFRDAAKQLKFTEFKLLLVQEDFCGCTMRGNHFLSNIHRIDHRHRRNMLIVLISPTMPSLDDFLAFSISLDAIINVSDLSNIGLLLSSVISKAGKIYTVFQEVLDELGLT